MPFWPALLQCPHYRCQRSLIQCRTQYLQPSRSAGSFTLHAWPLAESKLRQLTAIKGGVKSKQQRRRMTLQVIKHGRYLVRSDGAWEVLEGKAPSATAFTVLEFPSMEIARAWHSDPDYAPFIKLRRQHSELDLILVEGSTW